MSDLYLEIFREPLSIVCAAGYLHGRLDDVAHEHFEFSPVLRLPGIDKLVGMCFEPPTDLTMFKSPDTTTTVVSYSLDPASNKRFVEEIVESSGMELSIPCEGFVRDMDANAQHEQLSYLMIMAIAKALEIPVEKSWGSHHYINHLVQYRRMSEPRAIRISAEKFDIPQHRF